jgi:DNA-binding GntR family transcriptional regulator
VNGNTSAENHHRNIFNAIRDQDPNAAEAAMKEHIAVVIEEYTRRFYPGAES